MNEERADHVKKGFLKQTATPLDQDAFIAMLRNYASTKRPTILRLYLMQKVFDTDQQISRLDFAPQNA